MPTWNELLDECRTTGGGNDVVRRKYLKKLFEHTKRNVIVYYSGWLQKTDMIRQGVSGFDVNDADAANTTRITETDKRAPISSWQRTHSSVSRGGLRRLQLVHGHPIRASAHRLGGRRSDMAAAADARTRGRVHRMLAHDVGARDPAR